jgi:K+ transporter
MCWSLLIVTVKNLPFILRADNQGEGGIIALTDLLRPQGPVGAGDTVATQPYGARTLLLSLARTVAKRVEYPFALVRRFRRA